MLEGTIADIFMLAEKNEELQDSFQEKLKINIKQATNAEDLLVKVAETLQALAEEYPSTPPPLP